MEAPIAPTGGAEDVRADRAKSGDDPPAREVVVGVDGSEVGLAAVRWAAQEAARRGAPLRILHAAPYLARGPGRGAVTRTPARPRHHRGGLHRRPAHRAGGAVDDRGRPRRRRHRAAPAADAGQLVVLGSSATGAADEMVLAKLAARVAAHSPAPVIVVPRRRGGEPVDRPVVAVLGVGEPADDEAAAAFAATAAQRFGVPVSVLQTRASHSSAPGSWVDDLSGWAERYPDLEVEHTDLPAARANQVLGEACPSPLMVISAGHGTLLHRSLDGPHLWLLRHCTSPMALVPSVRRADHDHRDEAAARRLTPRPRSPVAGHRAGSAAVGSSVDRRRAAAGRRPPRPDGVGRGRGAAVRPRTGPAGGDRGRPGDRAAGGGVGGAAGRRPVAAPVGALRPGHAHRGDGDLDRARDRARH